VLNTIKNLETILTGSHSSASSQRPRGVGTSKDTCLKRDGHKCRVSGLQSGLISAHIAARRYAETIGVPTADIDKDENKVALLELLEKTLDTFEWTFDAEGNTSLLYPLSKAKPLLEKNNMKVHLVPENQGGPSKKIIQLAYAFALKQQAMRCPDCWAPRLLVGDMVRHRSASCPHRGTWDSNTETRESTATVQHLFVSGSVRGVGFRKAVKAVADELNLVGMVRNVGSDRVEMVCQGHPDSLSELRLRWGDSFQDAVVVVGAETPPEKHEGFKIGADAKDLGPQRSGSGGGGKGSRPSVSRGTGGSSKASGSRGRAKRGGGSSEGGGRVPQKNTDSKASGGRKRGGAKKPQE
jgi:acylphosphatase